jgi:prepilin-type N-terminal cleavage/methylation domain-containing protein
LRKTGQQGFTLVEVIVTVVAVAILAVFYVHFMGVAMDYSWRSVEMVEGEARAEGLMERIIAEYVEQINLDPDNALATIKGREGNYESDGNFGSNVTMDYVTYDSGGNYTVLPFPATSNSLKVTVEAPGNDFTTILTKSRVDTDNPIVYY